MNQDNSLENAARESLRVAGIENFPEKLTTEQVNTIIELTAQQKIMEIGLNAIVKLYPEFIKLAIEVANSAKESQIELIKATSSSQKIALENISNKISDLIEILKILASKSESDDVILKITDALIELGKQQIELAKINKEINEKNNDTYKEMNDDNNRFWIKIIEYAFSILPLIILGFIIGLVGGKKDK
jgi:hypothetical protein